MKLIDPQVSYQKEYLAMLQDWINTGEEMVPFPLGYEHTDFPKMVEKLLESKNVRDKGFVFHSTHWLMNDENKIVGVSNLRHELNDNLLIEGGHIGYGIRPGYRKKGYATKILALTLEKAKALGIQKALITCNKENIGSAKTILNNKGVLEKEHLVDGKMQQNYWIEIP